MLLLLAAALPQLFWEGAPETAPSLREAGITRIAVPASGAAAWKTINGFTVEPADFAAAVKLAVPAVEYRPDAATASRAPWIDSNGWQFARHPQGRFAYDAKGPAAALSAAEAFSYGAAALIRTDPAGVKPFGEMLAFLRKIDGENTPPVADIGFVDDGSPEAGEVMNLMSRNNLLYQVTRGPDPKFKLSVKIGTPGYSAEDAQDPSRLAHLVRANLTDEKRSLRIYGSAVVLGRLTGSGSRLRVHLLNYAGAARKVEGVRVRVLGRYAKGALAAAGSPGEQLIDYVLEDNATEFTLPELKTYAVVDLSR